MTETYSLAAKKRERAKHSARKARSEGRIPGVVYGKGVDSFPVSVDYSEFLRLFRRAGQSSLVDLDVEGKKMKVLIQDYDLDPVKDSFIHVDFYVVNLKEETTVHVPLIFEGESPAVKNLGGIFTPVHTELIIRCLPSDIPHDIVVDISVLKHLHDTITLKDLNLDEKLEVMGMEEDAVICSVTEQAAASDASEGEAGVEDEEKEEGESEGKKSE